MFTEDQAIKFERAAREVEFQMAHKQDLNQAQVREDIQEVIRLGRESVESIDEIRKAGTEAVNELERFQEELKDVIRRVEEVL